MKLVFLSNYYNHHQESLSEAFNTFHDVEYYFIETQVMEQERLDLGWNDDNKPDFVKSTYKSEIEKAECFDLINSADVLILGSAPIKYVISRFKEGKITFRYSERIFKSGLTPKLLYFLWRDHIRYKKYPQYLLCASAYLACDVTPFGLYNMGKFKWGYFPEVKDYDIEELLDNKQKKNIPLILWCGRFIDWKHPELAVEIARDLNENNIDFRMNMIGSGKMLPIIKKKIIEYNLEKKINVLGSMSPTQVRHYMESADIFLASSDYNEGWGAVINESMNSGCAVVASHAMGAVPFMIKNGINGFVYRNGDTKEALSYVKTLLSDKSLRYKLGMNAFYALKEEWNPYVAAKRFIIIANELMNSSAHKVVFDDGPCSEAKNIKQSEMFSLLSNNFKKEYK